MIVAKKGGNINNKTAKKGGNHMGEAGPRPVENWNYSILFRMGTSGAT
jgi:hypothetical protein